MPRSFHHVYWREKEQFLLETDSYDTWVLFAVDEGAFRFRIGQAEGLAEPGAVVACPPGVPFRRQTVSPVSFHFLRVEWEEPSHPALTEGFVRVASHSRLTSDLALLRRLEDEPSPDAEALKRHLVEDLFLFCFLGQDLDDADAAPSANDPLMAAAAAWIRERAHEKPFGIRQAAEHVGLTPVQFSRRFQAAFRTTPIRYVTEHRLQLAKELLSSTTLTIEQIAVRCGYDNAYYLSRVFKQNMQTSPSAYRKACQV